MSHLGTAEKNGTYLAFDSWLKTTKSDEHSRFLLRTAFSSGAQQGENIGAQWATIKHEVQALEPKPEESTAFILGALAGSLGDGTSVLVHESERNMTLELVEWLARSLKTKDDLLLVTSKFVSEVHNLLVTVNREKNLGFTGDQISDILGRILHILTSTRV